MTEKVDGRVETFVKNIIKIKSDGGYLDEEDIKSFVKQVVDASIQGNNLASILRALHSNELHQSETTSLTKAMMYSGEVLEWPSDWRGSIIDKHSTGGVGDKVSIVLVPALAACGMKVPMISGRALGHTGGTLDKLESIPGFSVSLTAAGMKKSLHEVGCCIVGQTTDLVPADKILYAARHATSTIDSVGLVTSSIISKKAAEKPDALILDVKTGRGAFFKDEIRAREAATTMVKAGNGCGMLTIALITDMDSPLGYTVGNSLEVEECIQCLHGNGPNDLVDLVTRLGGHLLFKVGKTSRLQDAFDMISKTLHDGSAILKLAAMMKSQGVSPAIADSLCKLGANVFEFLPKSKHKTDLKSNATGYIHEIDALKCATVSNELDAGRKEDGEPTNHAVGLQLHTRVGEHIQKGSTWVTIHHDNEQVPQNLLDILDDAFAVKPKRFPHVYKTTRVIDIIS